MKSPILPYTYSKDIQIPFTNSTIIENTTLLYDGKYPTVYKNEFRNMKDMYDCEYEPNHMESRVKIVDRIYSDVPEFIHKYANTEELKILYFDIETDTYMQFPNSQDNSIIAIGVAVNNEKPELFMADTYNDDKKILNRFFEYIEEHDPDIIVTFNGCYFDIPYICDRCKVNGISTSRFGRDDREVFNTEKFNYISGRVHYDIFNSVKLDQNLFKFALNKKMKTVARVYNLPNVIEEDESTLSNMRAIVGTQQLYDYLYSDIQVTRGLSNIYLPAILNLAEMTNISIDSCINGSPAYVPSIVYAREYKSKGIISDKTVITAYPELAEKQGAIVGCYKPGLYLKNLRKFDVKSMYPSIIRTLNLDALTTKIVNITTNLQPYSANMSDGKILTISFTDENLQKQITIEIDFNTRGFSSSLIDTLMVERANIKDEMKSLNIDSPEWASADVNQLNRKILMNSLSGVMGQNFAAFGSLASYMIITSTGRFLITAIMEQLNSVIAVDTDGAVLNSNENIDDINIWLENFILDFYGIDTNYIELEEEKFEAGYFRDAAKQYLLLEDGKLITHGASFKASNLTPIFRTIINDIGLRMLKDDPNLESHIDQYYDSNQFTLANIKKNIKVKPVANYATGNAIGKQLGIQYEVRFGTSITHETQLSYVKIKSKRGSTYQLVTIFDTMDDIERLDTEYYIEIVNSAIDRLGLTHMRPDQRAQTSIFDF